MPRVGSQPSERSVGGSQYELPPGRYRFTRCITKNEKTTSSMMCGYMVSAQPLDTSWKPTNDEPREEFIMAGFTSTPQGDPVMHPGKAKSSDDSNEELEIGGKLDAGDGEDAEGTCLLTVGPGPKRDSELSLFHDSAVANGVKESLFNGYAPNLDGLEAEVTRLMLPKRPGKDDKYGPPTALIIGRGGKANGADSKELIHKFPTAQTGGAAGTKPGPQAVSTVNKKANGATAPEPATTTADSGLEPDQEIAAKAIELLATMTDSNAGQTLTAQRIGAKMTTLLAKDRVDGKPLPSAVNKGVQALIKQAEWLNQTAEDLGWTVSGSSIVIPASA